MNTPGSDRRGVAACSILLIVAAWSHPPSTFADCPCPEYSDPLVSLEQSTAVFSGRVLTIHDDSDVSPITGTGMKKVDFRVDRGWKGIERTRISVSTSNSSAACGYEFSTGEEYLVYASGEKGDLQVSLCSRTQTAIDVGSEELAALGEPAFLPEYEDPPPLVFLSEHPVSCLSALAALAVLAIGYLLTKFKADH